MTIIQYCCNHCVCEFLDASNSQVWFKEDEITQDCELQECYEIKEEKNDLLMQCMPLAVDTIELSHDDTGETVSLQNPYRQA